MYNGISLSRLSALPASHPGAVVGHAVAAGQAGVKVRDAIGATDWSVLVDFTAAVHIATSGQVPLGHGESRSGERKIHSSSLGSAFKNRFFFFCI